MSSRTRRLSDQVLVLNAITCVREELVVMVHEVGYTDPRRESEIMERLTNLYSCIDTDRLAAALKAADTRSTYDKRNK